MHLFEKSLIGIIAIGYMTWGKGMAPFYAMGELKQNSSGKDLNITHKNTKAMPPNRQIGLPPNSSFFLNVKTTTIWETPTSL